MKGNGKKLSLPAYDEIFSTEESRADAAREKVMDIPLSELHPFAIWLARPSRSALQRTSSAETVRSGTPRMPLWRRSPPPAPALT